ncbi:Tata Box-Binding Protein-Like 2 [Manis pentadactyla]|nr:Tata Box-Binding Protein-Like 2 [Manis pentadactyla]
MATRGVAEAQPPERDDRIGLLMTLIHTADSSLEGKRDLGDSAACGGITAGSVGGDPGDIDDIDPNADAKNVHNLNYASVFPLGHEYNMSQKVTVYLAWILAG